MQPHIDVGVFIQNLEKGQNLFADEILGVKYWKLIRFPLVRDIELQLNLVEPGGRIQKKRSIIGGVVRKLKDISLLRENTPIVLVESPRKVERNGEVIDPYSDHVARYLREAGMRHAIVEDDSFQLDTRLSREKWYYSLRRKSPIDFSEFEKSLDSRDSFFRRLESEISSEFGVTVKLRAMIKRQLSKFLSDRSFFEPIFERVAMKTLFLVCSYGKEGIIDAARNSGARVVEIQHGTVYATHMGYAFPGINAIPYFPDHILAFSDAWFQGLPLPGVGLETTGYPFSHGAGDEKGLSGKDIDITFISQWVHSEKIMEFAESLAKLLPGYRVCVKPHPREEWTNELVTRFPDIEIIHGEDLGSVLKRSRFSSGVFSTGIFESMQFGCMPILLDMYGIANMRTFVQITNAPVAKSPEGFVAKLIEIEKGGYEYGNLSGSIWFAHSDLSHLKKIIES